MRGLRVVVTLIGNQRQGGMMSDAYRAVGNACPGCGVAMRPFGERMVCDGCGGLFLTVADLARSIDATSPPVLRLLPGTSTDRRCPRCQAALTVSAVQVGGEKRSRTGVLSCPADGVFVDVVRLTALLEQSSQRSASGREGTVRNGNLVADRVGLFRKRPPLAPPERRPWESEHKDARLPCPTCKIALFLDGERWACGKCAGLFVEEEPLAVMMTEMTHAPWEPPASVGVAPERPCPVCAETMSTTTIEAIPVERCAAHGVWFDAKELADALAAAGIANARRGWLSRLRGR